MRWSRRGGEWVVEPGPQVSIGEKIHAQQRHQVRERPPKPRLQLEVLEHEERDQSCPNLHVQRVGGGPDEALDAEVLPQRFEEQLDLPAVLVDPRDGRGAEPEMIRQEDQAITVRQDHFDATQGLPRGVLRSGMRRPQRDPLIRHHAAPFREGVPLDDVVGGGVLHSGDEEHAGGGQPVEPREVEIAAIEDQDRAGPKRLLPRDGDLVALALGYHERRGEVAVVVEGEMQLDRALGPAKRRPLEDLSAEINDGGVERHQLVLEPKLLLARNGPAAVQQVIEHLLVELPRPVLVGVGQRRALGHRDPQMGQLALTARQPSADLAYRVRAPELAKQHRHELAPTGEPAGVPLGLGGHDSPLEVGPWKELEQLAENAAESGQGVRPLGDV